MYIGKKVKFEEIISYLDTLIENIDNNKIKQFRWFQEKALTIIKKYLHDYVILVQSENKIIIAAIVAFVIKGLENDKEIISFYYFPVIISKEQYNINDLLLTIDTENEQYYMYDAIDNIEYVVALDKLLDKGNIINFKSNSNLIPVKLKNIDVYNSFRLSDKSSNSLTVLRKDEIIKTYRKIAEGINPDLELTVKLKEKGFKNTQDIRGYFLYEDTDKNQYTTAMVVEYVKNKGDMWQYTQEYLSKVLENFKDIKHIYSFEIEKYFYDYIDEIRNIALIIADMHVKLSQIEEEDFLKIDPTSEDIKEILDRIKANFNILMNYTISRNFSETINELIRDIAFYNEFFNSDIYAILDLYSDLGKYIRCHADLHLEQILKTENNYVIIDFEGEPTKSINTRRKKISPLKDVAGMVRSFNYAAYAAYFAYIKEHKQTDNEDIERILIQWSKSVTDVFLETYKSFVQKEAPDILPNEDNFNRVLALFKLEKALFEALYEVNNRPAWFKIPLKGIIECIDDIKFNKERVEINHG